MARRSARPAPGKNPPAPASGPAVSTVALAAPFVVAALTVIAYANACSNVIIHDDRFFYPSRAGSMRDRSPACSARRPVGCDGNSGGGLPAPALVSLAIDTALFRGGGLGAHVMNVVFHVLATLESTR